MEEKIIEIKNLTVNVFHRKEDGKTYKQNIYKNLNFDIYKKDRLVFIDHNGSGKSLLFDLIFGGFNNYLYSKGDGIEIESGEIIYKNKNILIPDEDERRPFCYITQDDPIRTNATVISQIQSECIANNMDINDPVINKKINNYLNIFGLLKKKNVRIGESLFGLFSKNNENHTLSFGEKKAVNLISKLITAEKKEVLLIDEPLNHLSFENSVAFNKIINDLILENPDLTILVISHCRGINFVNEEISFSESKDKILKNKYIKYNCFENECTNKCK